MTDTIMIVYEIIITAALIFCIVKMSKYRKQNIKNKTENENSSFWKRKIERGSERAV